MSMLNNRSTTSCSNLVRSICVLCLLDQSCLSRPAEGVQVIHLAISILPNTEDPLPTVMDVLMTAENNHTTVLRLKQTPHITANVPVYTVTKDFSGKHVETRAPIEDSKNVGYYQDTDRLAAIKLTTAQGLEDDALQFQLEGTLFINGTKHFMAHVGHPRFRRHMSSDNSAAKSDAYILQPLEHPAPLGNDYVQLEPDIRRYQQYFRLTASRTEARHRIRRNDKTDESKTLADDKKLLTAPSAVDVVLDVVAVVDFAAYQRFITSAQTNQQAYVDLRLYYAFVFNGVDVLYQSIANTTDGIKIFVKLAGIIICQTEESSDFTEKFKLPPATKTSIWPMVDANKVLDAFTRSSIGQGVGDHRMLFTGYDMSSVVDNRTDAATTGLAHRGTMCNEKEAIRSASVVEDLGGFQCVDTAAHELGHSLNAAHDGTGNKCQARDRYIMAGSSYEETSDNRGNPWRFSPCSIEAFVHHIRTYLVHPYGKYCFLKTSSSEFDKDLPDVSHRLPGHEFSPDQQCQMIYGNQSFVCRGSQYKDHSKLCSQIFCYDPPTLDTCYSYTAAAGTTCGNQKQCIDGSCVHIPGSPLADDECVFGDQPGKVIHGLTCVELATNGYYCYNKDIWHRCCASCKKSYRPIKNCEYGDRMNKCTKDICTKGSQEDVKNCCQTCRNGTTSTTTPQPSITSRGSTRGPQDLTTKSGLCRDDPTAMVNNMTCSTATIMHPEYCYQSVMVSACCGSCQRSNSGIKGCEFGDRFPQSCQKRTCSKMKHECCQTCAGHSSTAALISLCIPLILLIVCSVVFRVHSSFMSL